VPSVRRYICDAVTERNDITSQSLRDQWHRLVLCPLSKLDGNSCHSSYVLIVDALDECDDDNNIRIILQLLAEARSLQRVRLRVFLTRRPEIPIRCGFNQIPGEEREDFVLHSISPSILDHDISIFLEYNLRLIGQDDAQEPDWPGLEALRCLVETTSGLFIWAATACRFIREGLSAEERLRMLLEGGNPPSTPQEHLNRIYITVLRSSIQTSYIEQERLRLYSILRELLGSIVVLFSPLSVVSLSRLLHTTKQQSPIGLTFTQYNTSEQHLPTSLSFSSYQTPAHDPIPETTAHPTRLPSIRPLSSFPFPDSHCPRPSDTSQQLPYQRSDPSHPAPRSHVGTEYLPSTGCSRSRRSVGRACARRPYL